MGSISLQNIGIGREGGEGTGDEHRSEPKVYSSCETKYKMHIGQTLPDLFR